MVKHVSTEQDMAVYDKLPKVLREFLDYEPMGLDATTIREFYDQKLEGCQPLYTDYEVQQMVMKTLREYQRRQGVTDFRPVVARPGLKKRRIR